MKDPLIKEQLDIALSFISWVVGHGQYWSVERIQLEAKDCLDQIHERR